MNAIQSTKILFACVLLAVTMTINAAADPLLIDGKTVENSKPQPLRGGVQEKVLTGFSKNNFALPEKQAFGANLNAQSDVQNKQFINASPLLDSPFSTNKLNAAVDDKLQERKPATEKNVPANISSHERRPEAQKRVIVRIRRVISLMEAEVAEGALKTALAMLRKEPQANVTVFLDMDAVTIADGESNFLDQLSAGEDGNLRVISMKHLRSLLATFGSEGGKIAVSEHWVKVKGFRHHTNTIVPGCELLNDEELAELLLSATNVIDY